jgi:hypothetical protein
VTVENTNDDELSVTTTDENQTDESTSTQESTTADAGTAASELASETSTASSALDVLSEAIELANKGPKAAKQITPKSEELATDDSRPRNADGTFKSSEQIAADAAAAKTETPEQKATREAAEAAKKPDHINDPIDPSVKGRTAERMKYLIDTIKEQTVIAEQHAAMFDVITGTGANPEEFGQMVGYLKSVRSNDPKDLEMAYKVLQSELVGLAVRMGKPLYEVNLLRDAANKDLVDEVKAGTITSNRAHELALAREITRRGAAVRTTATAQQTEAQAYETAKDGAIKELDAMDKELRAKDGNEAFQAKYDALMPHFKSIVQHVPPAKWKAVFKDLYDKSAAKPASAVVVPASTTVATPKTKQMPLRPKAPAGGGAATTAPKTALDAMNEALGM